MSSRPKITFPIVALAVAGISISNDANAQSEYRSCAPRDRVIDRLEDQYGEELQSIGLGARGELIEQWASTTTGTWTITATKPSGQTCLVASGTDFQSAIDRGHPNPPGIDG